MHFSALWKLTAFRTYWDGRITNISMPEIHQTRLFSDCNEIIFLCIFVVIPWDNDNKLNRKKSLVGSSCFLCQFFFFFSHALSTEIVTVMIEKRGKTNTSKLQLCMAIVVVRIVIIEMSQSFVMNYVCDVIQKHW